MDKAKKLSANHAFQTLLTTMATLRGPSGCPWDKKQTHDSLKACLLEEAYEVLAAIDAKDPQHLREELGDLLLQVVFHSQIAQEAGEFEMTQVLEGLTEKLIRRHPHVFGDESVEHSEEALSRWEKIKATERGPDQSLLSGVPRELPALLRAYRIGAKTSRVGFDWPDLSGVLDKVHEELMELQESREQNHPEAIEEEFGDLLFSLAQTARFLKVNPEEALRKSTEKFQRRFGFVENKIKSLGKEFEDFSLNELEEIWQEAKSSPGSV